MLLPPTVVKTSGPWFPASGLGRFALALGAVSLIFALRDPVGLGRFVLGFAYEGVMMDTSKWQAWVEANQNFFGPVVPGAQIAVVEDVKDSTGLIITRTESGFKVTKTHFLRFRPVPLTIAMAPPVAAEILDLGLQKDGDRFWNAFKNMSRKKRLLCYRLGTREELEKLGFAAFLRNFDVYDPADRPTPHPKATPTVQEKTA